jgi:hypothetical protein
VHPHPGTSQARQRITDSLDASEITIILDATGSPTSRLRARFLGQDGTLLKIQVAAALGSDLLVSIAGEIETGSGRVPVLGKYRVDSCKLAGVGRYLVELRPEEPVAPPRPAWEAPQTLEELDYYEVLQVSRHADMDTIHRVFHVLAQRFHPDNRDTGSQDRFRQVVEAHAVLCDATRRAAYDVRLSNEDKSRLKIFDSLQSTQGVQAELRKRQGILRLLYGKRLTDSHQPALRGRDFAEMLGCPVEHLEFSFWFLREIKLITRADNNQYEITCHGVAAFEADEATFSQKPVLTLPAASRAG